MVAITRISAVGGTRRSDQVKIMEQHFRSTPGRTGRDPGRRGGTRGVRFHIRARLHHQRWAGVGRGNFAPTVAMAVKPRVSRPHVAKPVTAGAESYGTTGASTVLHSLRPPSGARSDKGLVICHPGRLWATSAPRRRHHRTGHARVCTGAFARCDGQANGSRSMT